MARLTVLVCAFALAIGVVVPDALACWDNTDQMVLKLKKLNLTTEQLKEIFVFHKQHKEVVARAHREGLGCRYHENHDAVFEKQAVGVLDNAQFKKHVGRERTRVESLEYDNRLLRKKIAKLEKRIKELEAALKAKK